MKIKGAPIEAKAYVAPWATLIAGYIVWFIFKLWPQARSTFAPEDQQQLIIFAGVVFTAIGTYLAHHTHRPDLDPVQPPQLSEPELEQIRYDLAQKQGGTTDAVPGS